MWVNPRLEISKKIIIEISEADDSIKNPKERTRKKRFNCKDKHRKAESLTGPRRFQDKNCRDENSKRGDENNQKTD
jgi:hypothetical protein